MVGTVRKVLHKPHLSGYGDSSFCSVIRGIERLSSEINLTVSTRRVRVVGRRLWASTAILDAGRATSTRDTTPPRMSCPITPSSIDASRRTRGCERPLREYQSDSVRRDGLPKPPVARAGTRGDTRPTTRRNVPAWVTALGASVPVHEPPRAPSVWASSIINNSASRQCSNRSGETGGPTGTLVRTPSPPSPTRSGLESLRTAGRQYGRRDS